MKPAGILKILSPHSRQAKGRPPAVSPKSLLLGNHRGGGNEDRKTRVEALRLDG